MTKKEQRKIINDLIRNVKRDIIVKSGKFPSHWDGIELRWYIRETFDGVVFGGYRDKREKRYKEFDNDCLVHGWYL